MECAIPSVYDDAFLRDILERAKRIAIIGLSPDESKDSHKVARYLLERGFDVIPVYPKEERILGQRVYRNLAEIPDFIDIVDVFRKSEAMSAVAKEAKERGGIGTLWGQLGICNPEAERILQGTEIKIVQNLCIKIEHRRLLGT